MVKIPHTFSVEEEAALNARIIAGEMELAYLKDEQFKLQAELWQNMKTVVFGVLEKYGKDSPEFKLFEDAYRLILEFEASQGEEDE